MSVLALNHAFVQIDDIRREDDKARKLRDRRDEKRVMVMRLTAVFLS